MNACIYDVFVWDVVAKGDMLLIERTRKRVYLTIEVINLKFAKIGLYNFLIWIHYTESRKQGLVF